MSDCGKEYKVRRGDAYPLCTYCGSIKPEDLLKFLRTPGTGFSGSDWKRGWPHKFYIDVSNPNAGELVEMGARSGPDVDGSDPNDRWSCFAHYDKGCSCPKEKGVTGYHRRVTMGNRERLNLKFYSRHLMCAPGDTFPQLVEAFDRIFQIKWSIAEGDLMWSARQGIQRYGDIGENGQPVYRDMADSYSP